MVCTQSDPALGDGVFSGLVLLRFSSEVLQGGAVSLHTETGFSAMVIWIRLCGLMTCASDRDSKAGGA